MILPKPATGTKAYDIYESVKAHLLIFFSVGGKVMLGCKRLLEVSLTPCPSNVMAQASGVASVVGVKAIGGPRRPDFDSRWSADVAEHRMNDIERGLALADLRLSVAGMLLAS